MPLTYHHAGAKEIPCTRSQALLHTEELRLLLLRPSALARQAIEAWCDAMHERMTLQGVPHVCRINAGTGMILQMWVEDPKALKPLTRRD